MISTVSYFWRKLLLPITLFLCSALIHSCDEKDGSLTPLLTIHIEPDYFFENSETWLFISDTHGNTIDVRNATDSTEIKFFGPLSRSFTLTVFTKVTDYVDVVETYFHAVSYQGIRPGTALHFRRSVYQESSAPVIGKADFVLNDYTECS